MQEGTVAVKIPTRLRHLLKRVPGLSNLWLNARVLSAPTFREDGLWTIHNCDFSRQERFTRAVTKCRAQMRLAAEVRDARWRWYTCAWSAHYASHLPGDFVDCGAGFGVTAMMILCYLGSEMGDRQYFLFDTFRGLDESLVTSKDRAADWNEYGDIYGFVRDSFKDFNNVRLVRGSIPGTLDEVDIEAVSFVHIDLNCVEPELAAMRHFWHRLVGGGIVLLDDYGWRGHEAQKSAHDDFAASHGLHVFAMPTGQGILLKPPT